MSFLAALAFVLSVEGGYVDHPADPGGATYKGISTRLLRDVRERYPDEGLPASVTELSDAQVEWIYQQLFWEQARCSELPAPIAMWLFDTAVNHGVGKAIQLLQAAVGVKRDGVIGPQTLQAVQAQRMEALLIELTARRAWEYATRKHVSIFGLGWMRRLARLHSESMRLA